MHFCSFFRFFDYVLFRYCVLNRCNFLLYLFSFQWKWSKNRYFKASHRCSSFYAKPNCNTTYSSYSSSADINHDTAPKHDTGKFVIVTCYRSCDLSLPWVVWQCFTLWNIFCLIQMVCRWQEVMESRVLVNYWKVSTMSVPLYEHKYVLAMCIAENLRQKYS